ncbi:MAG: TIGR01777 family oxidoreductase [Candidatus Sumerlaeaceae bacterium]|nr:TIGR01777 family oxidoreductase [Candidatus Sumerlaeaceae bacterium]
MKLSNSAIVISGAGGLVGSALVQRLSGKGIAVRKLVRKAANGPDEIHYDVDSRTIDSQSLEGTYAVIHLAGESIFGRWSAEKKRRILESRVAGTRFITECIAGLSNPPRVLLCASAIGFYGNRGDEIVDETSARGMGYLADVCEDWENATRPARDAGIRAVNMRLGIVLSPKGGALQQMLTPFRLGLGGPVGNGRQFASWVAMNDVLSAIEFLLVTESIAGPVNVVAPNPVTNAEFSKILGRVLSRPAFLPVPGFVLRLIFGEAADEFLLAGQRVLPRKLEEAGFQFHLPELEPALRHLLGKG